MHLCCRRGEVCSHVAAVLFKVEAACRLGYNKPTCTSLPCAWNQAFTTKVRLCSVDNFLDHFIAG